MPSESYLTDIKELFHRCNVGVYIAVKGGNVEKKFSCVTVRHIELQNFLIAARRFRL